MDLRREISWVFARSSSAPSRAESTIRAPASANSSARFRPSPLEDPVITTTFPDALQIVLDLRSAELASAAVRRAPLVVRTAGVRYLVRRMAMSLRYLPASSALYFDRHFGIFPFAIVTV